MVAAVEEKAEEKIVEEKAEEKPKTVAETWWVKVWNLCLFFVVNTVEGRVINFQLHSF